VQGRQDRAQDAWLAAMSLPDPAERAEQPPDDVGTALGVTLISD
jgi:hypothetical protein